MTLAVNGIKKPFPTLPTCIWQTIIPLFLTNNFTPDRNLLRIAHTSKQMHKLVIEALNRSFANLQLYQYPDFQNEFALLANNSQTEGWRYLRNLSKATFSDEIEARLNDDLDYCQDRKKITSHHFDKDRLACHLNIRTLVNPEAVCHLFNKGVHSTFLTQLLPLFNTNVLRLGLLHEYVFGEDNLYTIYANAEQIEKALFTDDSCTTGILFELLLRKCGTVDLHHLERDELATDLDETKDLVDFYYSNFREHFLNVYREIAPFAVQNNARGFVAALLEHTDPKMRELVLNTATIQALSKLNFNNFSEFMNEPEAFKPLFQYTDPETGKNLVHYLVENNNFKGYTALRQSNDSDVQQLFATFDKQGRLPLELALPAFYEVSS